MSLLAYYKNLIGIINKYLPRRRIEHRVVRQADMTRRPRSKLVRACLNIIRQYETNVSLISLI